MRHSKFAYLFFTLWFVQCGSPASDPASDLANPDQCADGQWDGQETDVDCGGPTCRACDYHKVCQTDRDCQGGYCLSIKVCGFPAMTLTGVSPAQGDVAGGTVLTLTGTNFPLGKAVSVSVAGVPATKVAVVSATQITATTAPSSRAGVADVVVTAPETKTATLAKSFVYNFRCSTFGLAAATNFSVGITPYSVAVGDA